MMADTERVIYRKRATAPAEAQRLLKIIGRAIRIDHRILR